ncbi:hypothetical protein [Lacinutrix sp. Hel_I_90]|uniref:hypothetical protein n=1 Tax=Lacinutrix sp. Hel_I_90 TaxID=1249999 RepID=UPI000698273A|nr:hypothetical protein [Lacinutrix sp. Hel_I_90]
MSFAARPLFFAGYVAYFELNIDYIIENYCVNKEKPQLQCNGKCHLAKQLASVPSSIDLENELALNNLVESFFPVFYLNYNYKKLIKIDFKINLDKILSDNKLYSFCFENTHFRPPIV